MNLYKPQPYKTQILPSFSIYLLPFNQFVFPEYFLYANNPKFHSQQAVGEALGQSY